MAQGRNRLCAKLLVAIAQHGRHRAADIGDLPVAVEQQHAIGAIIHNCAPALFAGAQRLLGLHPRRRIRNHGAGAPAGRGQRHGVHIHPQRAAVFPHHANILPHRALLGHCARAGDLAGWHRAAIGAQVGARMVRVRTQLGRGKTQQLGHGRVGIDELALLVQNADAHRQLLEQRAELLFQALPRLLGRALRRHIAVDADGRNDRAMLIANCAQRAFDHQLAAIAGALHHHAAPLAIAQQRRLHILIAHAAFVAQHVQHRAARLPQRLIARPAVDSLGRPIPDLNRPVCASHDHRVAYQVEPGSRGKQALVEQALQRGRSIGCAIGVRASKSFHQTLY